MKDILLTENGDLDISPSGDICITDSVRQAIMIRLRWVMNEWRFAPEVGIPYFEEIFVRTPNITKISQLFREAILSVDEVVSVPTLTLSIDAAKRKAVLRFTAQTEMETFNEEVELGV